MSLYLNCLLALLLTFSPKSHGAQVELGEKLRHQWMKYEQARAVMMARWAGSAPTSIIRQDWERMLAPDADYALTASDIEALKTIQRERIKQARARFKVNSVIDLDLLRRLPEPEAKIQIRKFCADFPKGGMLHVHPVGTWSRETVGALLNKDNPVLRIADLLLAATWHLYPDEMSWLRTVPDGSRFLDLGLTARARFMDFAFLPSGSHPFSRFDGAFPFVAVAANGSYDNYLQAFLDFGRRARDQGVSYVEFTERINSSELSFFANVAQRLERDLGIVARFNRSFFRLAPDASLKAELGDLMSYRSNVVVGIDLLGDETNAPALERGQLVYASLANQLQSGASTLHRTMHAGELGDPRNPRDAILLGAERLGHGVRLADDPVALEYAAGKKLPIEVNLTSNLRLQAVGQIQNHPYLDFLRLGLKVSLSTDDEGILETTINHECEVAVHDTDVTYAELKQMAVNSLETAFVDDTVRAGLLQRLAASFRVFESGF